MANNELSQGMRGDNSVVPPCSGKWLSKEFKRPIRFWPLSISASVCVCGEIQACRFNIKHGNCNWYFYWFSDDGDLS